MEIVVEIIYVESLVCSNLSSNLTARVSAKTSEFLSFYLNPSNDETRTAHLQFIVTMLSFELELAHSA